MVYSYFVNASNLEAFFLFLPQSTQRLFTEGKEFARGYLKFYSLIVFCAYLCALCGKCPNKTHL